MVRKAFETMVLDARAKERKAYGSALAAERGPMPGGSLKTEDQQDELWQHMDPQYADPHAFALLMVPKEQGGQGLTPLAASYTRYPNRQMLVEGAGADIESQTAYANKRRDRIQQKLAEGSIQPEMVPPEVLQFAQAVLKHYSPTPDNLATSPGASVTPAQQPMGGQQMPPAQQPQMLQGG